VKGNTDETGRSIYAALPYDGELLYPFRVDAVRRNCRKRITDEKEKNTVVELLGQLRDQLRPVWQAESPGEPCPYMALLLADGDRMGAVLDAVDGAYAHRQISSAVAVFAQAVPELVRDYRGHCIYAGGDDVFALVPLDQALECANRLRNDFQSVVAQQVRNKRLGVEDPTLSIGIGIGHMLEHFGCLRQLAQRAERLAKGDDRPKREQRNALAIIVRPRSGAEILFRDRWENDPHERLNDWVRMYHERQLPDGAAYELRGAARELGGLAPGTAGGGADSGRLASLEARRILDRKRGEGGETPVDPKLRQRFEERAEEIGLGRFADELIVGRWLARHVTE
jgi:CRISPR-associated protein Cmr2